METLRGLSISGFRSFAPDRQQVIGPLGKVHLLAGPNNSGKSNVLRVAQRVLPHMQARSDFDWQEGDEPQPARVRNLCVGIAVDGSPETLRRALKESNNVPALMPVLEAAGFLVAPSTLWLHFAPDEIQPGGARRAGAWNIAGWTAEAFTRASTEPNRRHVLSSVSTDATGSSGGNQHDDAARILTAIGREALASLPPVRTIGAFREIVLGEEIDDDQDSILNGRGLIKRLAALQDPQFGHEDDRERFDLINTFLGTLLDDEEVAIQIPHDHQSIIVRHRGRRLPLANYGTGVHQAVILAAAATVLTDHLVCIEEPEVHLHPTLQRKLIRYLNDKTQNQYLIATHSAHILDTALASISSVRQGPEGTEVSEVVHPSQVASIASELGLRASDLVQANAVVWVEGPSDRTYIKAWLKAVAPELIEGVHYSVVFYGGALLRHLSAEDPAIEEFISLPRINQNFWVVIDSDRRKADTDLNDTKLRVLEELRERSDRTGGWVTAGYTIENYVPSDLLTEAVKRVHPDSDFGWTGDEFTNPLAVDNFGSRSSAADKAAVAEAVVELWGQRDTWPLDLREKVTEVAQMIRQANDLVEPS